MGAVVSGRSSRTAIDSRRRRPARILSKGSCMTLCRVSLENPAKSTVTCGSANAISGLGPQAHRPFRALAHEGAGALPEYRTHPTLHTPTP